jgi:hypothetical protein
VGGGENRKILQQLGLSLFQLAQVHKNIACTYLLQRGKLEGAMGFQRENNIGGSNTENFVGVILGSASVMVVSVK